MATPERQDDARMAGMRATDAVAAPDRRIQQLRSSSKLGNAPTVCLARAVLRHGTHETESNMAQNQKQATQRQADAGLDLRNLLALDHKRLDDLFEALIAAFEGDAPEAAQQLWTKFEAELEAHFKLEEKLIFPEFAKTAPSEAAALASEHAALRCQLSRLGLGVDLHLTRDRAVSDFVRTLRSHAKREDALLYRWAQANLAEQSQTKLRAGLLAAVEEFLGIAQRT